MHCVSSSARRSGGIWHSSGCSLTVEVIMSIVSCKDTQVKREETSKEAMQQLEESRLVRAVKKSMESLIHWEEKCCSMGSNTEASHLE